MSTQSDKRCAFKDPACKWEPGCGFPQCYLGMSGALRMQDWFAASLLDFIKYTEVVVVFLQWPIFYVK